MRVEEITERVQWESFIAVQPHASFSQSWEWGEFQRLRGSDVCRLFVTETGKIAAACQFLFRPRRFFGYWFAPRGPVFAKRDPKTVRWIISALAEALHGSDPHKSALFYRFEPWLEAREIRGAFPLRLHRQYAMDPAVTVISDLHKTDEERLASMHDKTRYNIRVASRHGVKVRIGEPADLFAFFALTCETAARDRFVSHDERYLRAAYECLAPRGMARLRVAEYGGKILATNMEIAYGDTVTYLHGASSSEHRNVMAPYALHWDALHAAREEGFVFYDWWGCNPDRVSHFYFKPAWEGITRFKLGWGGERVEYAGTWDLPAHRILYRLAFPQFWLRG